VPAGLPETGAMAGPSGTKNRDGAARILPASRDVVTTTSVSERLAEIVGNKSPRVRALWHAQKARSVAARTVQGTTDGRKQLTGREILSELRTGYVTPHKDKKLTDVPGIVTHVKRTGFMMTIPSEDSGVPPISIYVFTGSEKLAEGEKKPPHSRLQENIRPGMKIVLQRATVSPFKSQTEFDRDNFDSPQLFCLLDQITVESADHPLPEPLIYGKAGWLPPKALVDDETLRHMRDDLKTDSLEHPDVKFDPERGAIAGFRTKLYELMAVKDALIVAASDDRKYFYVVPDGGKSVTHLSPEGAAVYTEDNYPTEPVKIDVAALPLELRHMVTVGDRIKGDLVGVMEYSFGNYQLRLTEPFEVVRGGLKPGLGKRIDDRADRLVYGTRNVENFSVNNVERRKKLVFNFIVRSLAPDFEGWQEIQDDSGPKDDGVVSAKQTMDAVVAEANALFKKIKSGDVSDLREAGLTPQEIEDVLASLPDKADYDYAQIDPVDGGNGGQPGGNIRPVTIFNRARVNFDARGNAKHDTEAKIVDSPDGGAELSHNPALVAPKSEAFDRSRKPLVVEFEFNGEKFFYIVNHLMSKRGDSNPWGVNQPMRTPSADRRVLQTRELAEFVKMIQAKDKDAKIIVVGDMNEFHFNKPMTELTRDGTLVHMPSALLEGAQIFSYVHDGRAQALDQMFASAAVMALSPTVQFLHDNELFASKREPKGGAGGRPPEKDKGQSKPDHKESAVSDDVPVIIQISDHGSVQGTAKVPRKKSLR
jgi:hypothetical protein